jgi:hypothetical protein
MQRSQIAALAELAIQPTSGDSRLLQNEQALTGSAF